MPTATGTYATTATLKARLLPAGVTDTTDDTLLGTICDQVNQFIETYTERILAPISSAVYTFDGDNSRVLYVKRGVRAVTLLEVAEQTGGSYNTVTSTDYVLRPTSQDRKPGWPATRIEFIDVPTGNYTRFPYGYDTVRVTMTSGWTAIPDDIVDVALTTATRMWASRQTGQADIIGVDETGAPQVSRFVSPFHWKILRDYKVGPRAV